MDDLYNNAWGDPSKPAEDITETVLGARSTWTSPKATTRVEDDEADLAAPSWSTGAGISWDEPSDDTHGFGWSQSESDMAWGASTYEGIHIAKPIEVTPEEVEVEVKEELPVAPPSPPSPKEDLDLDFHDVKTVNESTTSESIVEEPAYKSLNGSAGFSEILPSSPSVSDSDETPRVSRAPSPDGFGTFESAVETEEVTSPGFAMTESLEDNAWGGAWAEETDGESKAEEPVDEWEVARRQKEAQDRKVVCTPTHVILCICLELLHSLLKLLQLSWPSVKKHARASFLLRNRTFSIRTPPRGEIMSGVAWTSLRGCESINLQFPFLTLSDYS